MINFILILIHRSYSAKCQWWHIIAEALQSAAPNETTCSTVATKRHNIQSWKYWNLQLSHNFSINLYTISYWNGIMKNHYKTVYALPLRPSRMADFHCAFQTDTECHEWVQRAKERDKRKVWICDGEHASLLCWKTVRRQRTHWLLSQQWCWNGVWLTNHCFWRPRRFIAAGSWTHGFIKPKGKECHHIKLFHGSGENLEPIYLSFAIDPMVAWGALCPACFAKRNSWGMIWEFIALILQVTG